MTLGTYVCEACGRECRIGYGMTRDDCVYCNPCAAIREMREAVEELAKKAQHVRLLGEHDSSLDDAWVMTERIGVATGLWLAEWKGRTR